MDEQAADRGRSGSVPLFSGSVKGVRSRVAAIVKEVSFPAGKDIAKQGESGVGFHMICGRPGDGLRRRRGSRH